MDSVEVHLICIDFDLFGIVRVGICNVIDRCWIVDRRIVPSGLLSNEF